MRIPIALLVALLLPLCVAGCDSPEAARSRGAGPGGDVGNRPAHVRLHEGSRPYHETPRLVPVATPSLAPANQARQSSLR